MKDPEIYTEEQARFMIALAIRDGYCAALLNCLAGGGAVTFRPDGRGGTTLDLIDGETFADWYEQLTGGPT